MSNRLRVAHVVPRREPREFMPAPGIAATALRWLRDFAASDAPDLSPALRRDLGLPAGEAVTMDFASAIERSRVRV
jgi:hypothetical protein